jgi:hypothetical protein
MSDKFDLVGIYFLSKDILYTKGKKIKGTNVVFGNSSQIGIDRKEKHVRILTKVNLHDGAKSPKVYARFEIGFVYEYKTIKNEKNFVNLCLWDSYTTMKGLLYLELQPTLLKGTIIPTFSLEEMSEDIKKTKKPKAKA